MYDLPSHNSQISLDCPTSIDSFSSDSESRKSISVLGPDIIPAPERKRQSVGATPYIECKPIEFWTANVNKEQVQPRQYGPRRNNSVSKLSHIQPNLYESFDESPDMTDDEKRSLYNLGQVHISLQYDVTSQALLVKVIEASDLCCRSSEKKSRRSRLPNPYVKVCLLPDQKTCRQTSVKLKADCPKWEEVFPFEIPHTEAQRRTLEVTVMDHSKNSRHMVLGEIHLPLLGVNIVRGRHMWKPLIPSGKVESFSYLIGFVQMTFQILNAHNE